MSKKRLSINQICEIGLLSSICLALDFLQGGIFKGIFPSGGSIGLSMIPLLVLAYRRGLPSALVGGICVSFLQMLGGVYAISDSWYKVFFQILLDYILTYPMVSLAALFYNPFKNAESKNKKVLYVILGTTLGGFLKFLCHFIAGILFWANFSFPGGPVVYSLVYNGAYMLPNIIISCIVMALLVIKMPTLFIPKQKDEVKNNEQA